MIKHDIEQAGEWDMSLAWQLGIPYTRFHMYEAGLGTEEEYKTLIPKVARARGVRLERPPALNDDPLYIETIANLVPERTARWLPQPGSIARG